MPATLDAPQASPLAALATLHRHVAEYRDKGYTVLRGAFSRDEVAEWEREVARLLALDLVHPDNHRTPFRKGASVEAGAPERIDPVIDLSPTFRTLAHDERILTPLRAIFNDGVHVFKDKLIFKGPGVEGYDMHQGGSWWQMLPVPKDEMLSVMIAIDGAAPDNGPLELFPGYHRSLLSTPGEIRNMNAEETKAIDLATGEVMLSQPGDVIIFHALAPHRSGRNQSDRYRRQFYLTYNAASHGDLYEEFYARDREMKLAKDRQHNPNLYYR